MMEIMMTGQLLFYRDDAWNKGENLLLKQAPDDNIRKCEYVVPVAGWFLVFRITFYDFMELILPQKASGN